VAGGLIHGARRHAWLAEAYRVIAPDLRGLGDSSRPVAGYDEKTLANDEDFP
jgi:pimeloyl-ACP methyl ester carboxylesterase